MMAKYKTALGRTVDMSALAAKNERTRAVGNMKVNARGDTIDSMGNVIKSVTSKVNSNYAKTVGNRSAKSKAQSSDSQKAEVDLTTEPVQEVPAPVANAVSEYEPISDTTEEEDEAIELIKAKNSSSKSSGKKHDTTK